MKKTIILGSLLSVFLLIMIPNVSAIEYHTLVEENKTKLISEINNESLIISTISNKMSIKNINEHINMIRNGDIDEIKNQILTELNSWDLSEEEKIQIFQSLDAQLLFSILIQGILLPFMIMTIYDGFVAQHMPFPIDFILALPIFWFIDNMFIIPVAEMIEEETGLKYNHAELLLLLIVITIESIALQFIES